jgi:hypothetical protein
MQDIAACLRISPYQRCWREFLSKPVPIIGDIGPSASLRITEGRVVSGMAPAMPIGNERDETCIVL